MSSKSKHLNVYSVLLPGRLPEPAEHVTRVAPVATVVAPGEPVVELGQFVLPGQVPLLVRPPRAWGV